MTEPRALLEAYAAEYQVTRGPREVHAPEAFAALRAVLDIHKPHPPSLLSTGRYCLECTDEYVADWPCPTARAITTALEAP